MIGVFYPRAGQQWLAGIVRTALANSKIRLFQSTLVADDLTDLATLEAAEADYDGYAEIAMVAWGAVYQSPLGAATQSPQVQFQPTGSVVTNSIGGAWIETAGGVLVSIIGFPAPKAMASTLDAIPISEILRFGTGL
jgi:hypothetical protein